MVSLACFMRCLRQLFRTEPTRPELSQPKALLKDVSQNQQELPDTEAGATEGVAPNTESLLDIKAPTACELLTALPKQKRPKKYPLEQICAPTTALSYELEWDGPGTLWADLGILPCSFSEDSFDPAALMDVAPSPNVVGSYRWS